MAKGIIISGGNGGDGSDDCTVTADKVVSGEIYIGADTDDEISTGTLPDMSSQTDGISLGYNTSTAKVYMRIPTGAYRTIVAGQGYPEVMLPVSTVNSAIGLTSAKLLAGQVAGLVTGTATSDATATDAYVYSGKTYYRNGVKGTGSMTVSSVVSFSVAAYSTSQVLCTWKNPAKGPYSGVIIRYKTGSYPTSATDGTLGYQGSGSSYALNGTSTTILSSLTAGSTYYFRIWMYCNTSLGTIYSGYVQTTGSPSASGRSVFTSSGTFTVPTAVRSINIHVTGGGSSGVAPWGDTNNRVGGGGGGGGYTAYKKEIAVTPGQKIAVVVGSGGIAPEDRSSKQRNGGTSSATLSGTTLVSASGGGANTPTQITFRYGISGGSGGGDGAASTSSSSKDAYSTAGYSDGNGYNRTQSVGQGTTTREMGSSNGTLYSGGGGGGGTSKYMSGSESYKKRAGSAGGAGGGGAGGGIINGSGSFTATVGTTGSAGTGGGGGGGSINSNSGVWGKPGNGGTGNVIITW